MFSCSPSNILSGYQYSSLEAQHNQIMERAILGLDTCILAPPIMITLENTFAFLKTPCASPIHLSFPTKFLRPLMILLPTVYQAFYDWLLSLSNVQFRSLQAFDSLF